MQPQYIILPKQAKDLTGQQFGRLTALGPIGQTPRTQIKWECKCDCGNIVTVSSTHLRTGHTQSCGCLANELTAIRNTTHGQSRSKLHWVWSAIVQRCTNPNCKGYKNYGGRGITIFSRWRESFEEFRDYITGLPSFGTLGYSLDRIDNDKGYEPGNVRWASRVIQSRNSRSNRMITHAGRTQCLQAWADELQMGRSALKMRFRRGWSVEKALTTLIDSRATNE